MLVMEIERRRRRIGHFLAVLTCFPC